MIFYPLFVFWIFALLNPVFQKYDYGAGWPVVILFGVLLGIFGVFEMKRMKGKSEKSTFENVFLIVFMAAVILSFVFSQTKNIGLSELVAFLSVGIFYLLFAHKKINWDGKFLKVLAASVILAVILGYIFYFTLSEPRMFGPFFNILYHANKWPNAFALFLLLSWPVFFVVFKKNVFWKIILSLSFVISGLLLTYSRGALIAFSGEILLLGIYYVRKINFKIILGTIFVVILTSGFFFGANFIRSLNHEVIDTEERITFSNNEELTSVTERLDFFNGAIKLIEEKPFFGWGPFSFRYAYNPIQKTLLGSSDHPHNLFLKIGAENGLIALFAFLAFLASVFVIVVKRFKSLGEQNKNFVFVLCTGVLGALAHSLIDYNFNFFQNLLLLFAFLIFIRSKIVQKETNRNIVPKILAVFLSIFVLYEGAIFTASKLIDEDYLRYSFYPRNYYLTEAEGLIKEQKFDEALILLDKQIKLNPLDSQSFNLKSVVYCDEKYENYLSSECEMLLSKTIELNPLNDIGLYLNYFINAEKTGKLKEKKEEISKTVALLETYFKYAQNNVHFTAYTGNVESAYELSKILLPYLNAEEKSGFQRASEEMMETVSKLRENKKY